MKNSYLKYALGLTNLFLSLLTAAQTVSVTNYWEDRQAAISLTFDDGVQEHYTLVAPHLDRYALKGTFGINGKYIGDIDEHYAPRLTWEECRIMARNGHEICSHSWSHPNLTEIDSLALQTEIRKNDSVIQAETGIAPTSFLYPFNAWTPQVKSACEKNKIGSRLCQFALGQRNSGCTATSINAWLREQIDQRLWGVTMTHGIYTAWDQWDEPWILWEFFRDLAFKKDSVWIDTFSNIQAYLKERNAITLTTVWEKTDFVITPTLTLDRNLFQMPLTLKIDGLKKGQCIEAVQDGKHLQVSYRGNYSTVNINPYGSPVRLRYILQNPLKNKTLCVIGDSYVYNHGCPFTETWHYKVAQKYRMNYLNMGQNGNCIAFERDSIYGEPLYKRYHAIPKNTDYILIIAGHNDAYMVGENIVQQQVLRCHLDELLKGLKKEYPHAKIGWVTPWNVAYKGFPATISIIEEVCHKYGISVLNAAYTSGIRPNDPVFRAHYFQGKNDTAHLNSKGHDLLIQWGEQFLMGL